MVFISRTVFNCPLLPFYQCDTRAHRTNPSRATASLEKKKNQVIPKTNCFPECKIAVQRRVEFYDIDHVAQIAVCIYFTAIVYRFDPLLLFPPSRKLRFRRSRYTELPFLLNRSNNLHRKIMKEKYSCTFKNLARRTPWCSALKVPTKKVGRNAKLSKFRQCLMHVSLSFS